MIYDILKEYLDDVAKQFIAQNHIFLYIMRKNFAIINFILTCKLNKDYVYYKTNPLGYFIKRLEKET